VHQGHVRAGEVEKDVAFTDVGHDIRDELPYVRGVSAVRPARSEASIG
jgi:hypothetical protein